MHPGRFWKAAIYYPSAFLQGLCLILVPAAGFILKSPEHNRISDGQYGALFLALIAGVILVTFLTKRLIKTIGKERIFYLGFLHNILFLVFLALASPMASPFLGWAVLLLSNFFLGVGFGLLVGVLNLLCVELFPENRNAVITGLHACLGIGAAAAPLLVNFMYMRGIWMSGLISLALSLSLFAAGSYFLKPVPVVSLAVSQGVGSGASKVSSLPCGAMLFLLTIFFYGLVEAIIGNWSTVYLMDEKGFSLRTSSLALSTFWFFMTTGRVLASVLMIKMDARALYRISPLVMVVSLLAIILTNHESRVLWFYISVGLGCSYFFPVSISLSTQYFDSWRDDLASLAVAALMLGTGVGSFAVGLFYDKRAIQLGHAFASAAACSVMLAASALFLTRLKVVGAGA